jgi:protein TonB
MRYAPLYAEHSLGIEERRARPRLHPISLIFINLDDLNGGVVFNISEDGLAISTAMILPDGDLPTMRIQFPGSSDWTPVNGRIVWKSKSKKEAGVQFLGLTEEAREQLRRWIESEASPDESDLELTASHASLAQDIGHRMKSWMFSEASRGEFYGEEGAPLVDLPKELGDRMKRWMFPGTSRGEFQGEATTPSDDLGAIKETELLNGTVFTDHNAAKCEIEDLVSKPGLKQTKDTAGNFNEAETPSRAPDRRAHLRKRIIPLGYIQLGESNGGIALNVSEGGLAITTALMLPDDYLPNIRLQFPDSSDEIEVCGHIAWRAESKKEAGIKFVGLTEKARRQITNWISSQASPGDVPEQMEGIWEKHATPPHVQNLPQLENPILRSSAMDDVLEQNPEISLLSLEAGPAMRGTATPRSHIAIGKQVDKAAHRYRRKIARRDWNHDGRQRVLGRLAAIAAVIGIIFLALEWFSLQPNAQNRMIAAVGQKAKEWSEPLKKESPKNETPLTLDSVPTAPGPDVKKTDAQALETAPSPAEVDRGNRDASAKNPRQQTRVAERPPAKSVSKIPGGPVKNEPAKNELAQGQASKEFSRVTASVNNHPAERTQPQIVTGPPPEPPQPKASITVPTDSASNLTNSAPPPEPSDRGNLPLSSKQPEVAFNVTGSVSIRTDPYPSLRMPAERGSKKSKQGESLQLGYLMSRVEPVYPEEAKNQGVEGTVKMHAVIGRNGTVQGLMSVDGPPLLVPAAMSAVQRWRYSETLLAGHPVETEEDIAIMFRLSKSTTPRK